MRKRKFFCKNNLWVVSVFALFIAFGGHFTEVFAADAVNPDLKGEITIWSWGNYEKNGAADFSKFYPNIKVNFVMVPSSDYLKKIQIAVAAGGELPDVVQLEVIPRGKEFSLDAWERLDAPPYNLDKNDVVDWALSLITNQKGEVVCMQSDNCVGGYAYKRSLAKEYFGTDDPAALEKIFTSWDVYLEKGREVAKKSGGKVFLFSGTTDAFSAIEGLYTKEPFVKDNTLNLDTSILPTYKILAQLVKDGSIGKYQQWSPPWNASFGSNTVIFYGAPTWFVPFVIKANDKKGDYGLLTPPEGGFSWGGTCYAIPKTGKNKELAWAWIHWLTLTQAGAESFVNVHSVPTLYKKAYETELYSKPDPYFAGQNILEKYLEIAKHPNTHSRALTEYDAIILETNGMILQQIEQGLSADEAYRKLKEEILKKVPELKS